MLGVPCLTLRTTTERPVTAAEGANRLIDPYDAAGIVGAADAVTTAISGPPPSDLPLLGRPDRRLRCIAGIVASAWRWAVRKPRRVAAHLGRRRERHPCGPQAAGRVPRISLRVTGYEPSFGSPRFGHSTPPTAAEATCRASNLAVAGINDREMISSAICSTRASGSSTGISARRANRRATASASPRVARKGRSRQAGRSRGDGRSVGAV